MFFSNDSDLCRDDVDSATIGPGMQDEVRVVRDAYHYSLKQFLWFKRAIVRIRWTVWRDILTLILLSVPGLTGAQKVDASNYLDRDQSVSLRFSGSVVADRFTRELQESFDGVLQRNFVTSSGNGFPAGFVNASVAGHPWAGTMWTRDAGTYMRELVMRGYYAHASLLAECLIDLVEKNPDGFYSFPRYFRGAKPGWGTEFDGTAAIVIGMVTLWERLSNGNPMKARLQEFLLQRASPINYFKFRLSTKPLVAGTGEFGCGMGVRGECYNVVQNNLTMLALLAAANLADESGSRAMAKEYRRLASGLQVAMEKYLVDQDGSWIWCVDAQTMKPDPKVLDAGTNRGFGGINGVASMYADVLGFEPLAFIGEDVKHSEKTFEKLYETAERKQEFNQYGIWTQFDVLAGGMLTSPSYGQGYAIQTMLLYDNTAMSDKALAWLANATYQPLPEYKLQRDSPWYFYERMYSPGAVAKVSLDAGCGELNLVNVTEPLKISRLLLGLDDSSLKLVKVIPRIPMSWRRVEASHWPIRSRRGVVRANIVFERNGSGAVCTLKLPPGEHIDNLSVRMPSNCGYVWRKQKDATEVRFVTQ